MSTALEMTLDEIRRTGSPRWPRSRGGDPGLG
jgi:hypothetical protein